MNIGLYFGSFNPIHQGHLIIANHIINATNLDKIWFILSPQNPFKPSNSLLNEYDRLHLLQLAIENDERMKAMDIEFNLPKPSYTSLTLVQLQEKYPDYTFSIIIGGDSFQNIHKWKNATFILNNYHLYVYPRPGFDLNNEEIKNFTVVNAPLLDISSTYIRNELKKGNSIHYLMPEKVRKEIEDNGYYKK